MRCLVLLQGLREARRVLQGSRARGGSDREVAVDGVCGHACVAWHVPLPVPLPGPDLRVSEQLEPHGLDLSLRLAADEVARLEVLEDLPLRAVALLVASLLHLALHGLVAIPMARVPPAGLALELLLA
eukprot:12101675-Alexandrium_andersonii.AAC.1